MTTGTRLDGFPAITTPANADLLHVELSSGGDFLTRKITYANLKAAITGTTSLTVNNTTISGGTNGRVLYDNAGVLGEYTISGTGSVAMTNSPTLVTPALGTPTSGTLTSCTGLPISTGVSGLGTGIATALAVNTGSAGAPVLFNGALGTPTSGVATNLTGTASGLTAGNVTTNANLTGHITSVGNATTLGSFTAAQLLSALSTNIPEVISLTPSADQNNYATGISTNMNVLSEVRIAPTNSIQITGISATSVVNGKRISITNTTDPSASTARMILIPRESASSTAANRISYSPNSAVPIILMPGDTIDLIYNTTSSRWVLQSGNRHGSPYDSFDQFNDFVGGSAPFTTSTNGTGAATAIASNFGTNTTQKAMGELQCTTGTTTTGGCHVGTSSAMTLAALGGCALFLSRQAVDTLSDGTDTYIARAGFNNGTGSTAPTNGVYWEYDQTTSTDWRTVANNNSAATKNTVTGFTVSTTVMHYTGIFINGDWTNAEFFYSTDGDTWTIFSTQTSTNLPTNARSIGVRTGIIKSAGTTSRAIQSDYMGWRYMIKRGA
jgi:hypothetical protein